ncbi:MAG: hypothetical protein D6716_01020, partial [Chloroflexi bacterium]
MRRLIGELQKQLKYQIIGPFLLLAIVVAIVGLTIVAFFLASQQQDRFDNELAAATRTVSDA